MPVIALPTADTQLHQRFLDASQAQREYHLALRLAVWMPQARTDQHT